MRPAKSANWPGDSTGRLCFDASPPERRSNVILA